MVDYMWEIVYKRNVRKELIRMTKRMTWAEIAKTYPNQWVGLTDVVWEDSSNIGSAVVTYTNRNKDDLQMEQFKTKGKMMAVYTNPNRLFELGVLG